MSSCECDWYTYCAELEKTKALSKSKAANDVSSHQRPPLEDVNNAIVVGTVICDLVDGELDLFAHDILKVLSDVRLREALCKKTTT